MIVRILQKSATFKGVQYNTNKVDKDKGELMAVKNFGVLQALEQLRPKDYINYLSAISAQSKRTKYPQLHVVISAEGKSKTKEELTNVAEKWLEGMGYGEQPYLLIFHKDTNNNHIHLVSTRVGKDGKKISDSFEKLKAYQVLNRIQGLDKNQEANTKLERALSYNFSTRPQFMMLLEAQGYAVVLSDNQYKICKYGRELTTVSLDKVDGQIANYDKKLQRIKQLHAIFRDYRLKNDPTIYPITKEHPSGKATIQTGHSSKLSEVLREKFGVEVFFHSNDNKTPYGYTIIDHANKAVFKGKQIMDLSDFISPQTGVNYSQNLPEIAPAIQVPEKENEDLETLIQREPMWVDFTDHQSLSVPADNISYQPLDPLAYDESGLNIPEINLDISDDIDDEAILGRNRQRKRKARTNTR